MVAKDKTEKTYTFCNLFSFVKIRGDTKLLDVIEAICMENTFKSKRLAATFLYPSDKLIDILYKLVFDDYNFAEARDKLKSLFLEKKHETLTNGKYITFNKKEVSKLENAVKKSEWKHVDDKIGVLEYVGDKFPEEGETVIVKGSNENQASNLRIEITNNIINKAKKDYNCTYFETFGYALNSLLQFIYDKDKKLYKMLENKFDPNLVVTWYIYVQPTISNPTYISNELFQQWGYHYKNSPNNKSFDFLKELLNNYVVDDNKLKKQKEKRNEIKTKKLNLDDLINEIINKVYNSNYLHLLEDELRFRYSDMNCFTKEDIMTFNLIDWDNPKNSLTLFKKPDSDLQKIELYNIIVYFITSNYFLYTLYDKKLTQRILQFVNENKSGGNSSNGISFFMGGCDQMNKIMDYVNSDKFNMTEWVNGLSDSRKDELKKILNN